MLEHALELTVIIVFWLDWFWMQEVDLFKGLWLWRFYLIIVDYLKGFLVPNFLSPTHLSVSTIMCLHVNLTLTIIKSKDSNSLGVIKNDKEEESSKSRKKKIGGPRIIEHITKNK